MKSLNHRRIATLVAFIALLGATPALAQGKKKPPKPKPDPYTVVKVDEEIRVIKKTALRGVRFEVDQEYKAALKEHAEALKTAKKNKEKVNLKRPKKAKVRVLKATCKTKESADKFVAAYLDKEAKKKAAKEKARERAEARKNATSKKKDSGEKKKEDSGKKKKASGKSDR